MYNVSNSQAFQAKGFLFSERMRRGFPITDDEEASIKSALEAKPNALFVARESKGAWSYSTVWRVADRAGIALTAGRETMGRPRISAALRAAVIEAVRANPKATQKQIGREFGLSRASVSRIEGGRRRPRPRCVEPG
jgi:hypothetical protein